MNVEIVMAMEQIMNVGMDLLFVIQQIALINLYQHTSLLEHLNLVMLKFYLAVTFQLQDFSLA